MKFIVEVDGKVMQPEEMARFIHTIVGHFIKIKSVTFVPHINRTGGDGSDGHHQ